MLTKSNYLLGLQCPKLLWISKNAKNRLPEIDAIQEQKFKDGNLLGELATKVFPKGQAVPTNDFKETLKQTELLMLEKIPIFEASFRVGNLYLRTDILFPVGNEWDIIEVKSATKVKDINLHDVSFQKYVCELAGLKIRKCFLMHINNEYVKKGEVEPRELFVQTDITDQVEEYIKGIKDRIEDMLEIINSIKEPKISIGCYCSDPYDCPLRNECWKDIPDGSVFEFYRMLKTKTFELYDDGIVKLNEVPDSVKLNDKQKIQRILSENGGIHLDKDQIKFFLKNLKYPIYYLDFETINPSIPKFDGMKPYKRIPFQFSLHIQDKPDGKLKHISFLADGVDDPRPKFMQALKDNLGEKGDIIVYNQGFEKGVMNECADSFPEFREWYDENILPRVKDLWDVFRNFWYYDPKQKGSASIKAVLPVLSNLKYSDLEIKKGDVASFEWERITFLENVSDEEKEKVRKALEKYCELDTLAEFEIIKGLKKALKEDGGV